MFAKLSLILAALQISLAAAGNAIVSNRCSYDIWIWSVDINHAGTAIKVPAGKQYSEPYRTPSAGGVALKVSKSNQIVNGAHTQFEYTITNNQLWFDISFVNCASGQSADKCPGHEAGLSMTSAQSSCGSMTCKSGSYCPTQAYYVDQPMLKLGSQEPVATCPGAGLGMDLLMKVCADKSSKRSIAGRLLVDME